jgi:hypothetical protein
MIMMKKNKLFRHSLIPLLVLLFCLSTAAVQGFSTDSLSLSTQMQKGASVHAEAEPLQEIKDEYPPEG